MPIATAKSNAGESFSNIALPAGAKLYWVSKDLQQNGVFMSIATFQSPLSNDDVMAFYRTLWRSRETEDPGYLEDRSGPWSIISKATAQRSIVLQLQDSDRSGSSGYMSIIPFSNIAVSAAIQPVIPPGAHIISSTRSGDLAQAGTTWIISSAGDQLSAVSFYRSSFEQRGWQLMSAAQHDGSFVLLFSRGGDRNDLVIGLNISGNTIIVLNQIRSNE